jgi:hypothetical protein
MDMVTERFVTTVFTKNRDQRLAHDVAAEFFRALVAQARSAKLTSSDQFAVYGSTHRVAGVAQELQEEGRRQQRAAG